MDTSFHIETLKIKARKMNSIERYLGSGAVKGIGVSLAARIVRKFHEDTFRIMEEEPESLRKSKALVRRRPGDRISDGRKRKTCEKP